jgi:hypothetical protein
MGYGFPYILKHEVLRRMHEIRQPKYFSTCNNKMGLLLYFRKVTVSLWEQVRIFYYNIYPSKFINVNSCADKHSSFLYISL